MCCARFFDVEVLAQGLQKTSEIKNTRHLKEPDLKLQMWVYTITPYF